MSNIFTMIREAIRAVKEGRDVDSVVETLGACAADLTMLGHPGDRSVPLVNQSKRVRELEMALSRAWRAFDSIQTDAERAKDNAHTEMLAQEAKR